MQQCHDVDTLNLSLSTNNFFLMCAPTCLLGRSFFCLCVFSFTHFFSQEGDYLLMELRFFIVVILWVR